ncbi:ExeA family protein [Comamonas sp. NLF-1-9]|uniref:ExeA family protein n=1 Tax=Comamonas sp. NLF-1-9 TaxID=2853163 RepID=UPI001C487C87|nr:ExeA family protein [Comamonas sp. NLF-1-9]QXL84209.1 AAA family ATPase [Comamonas sp. NLF-1-9]
MYAAYFGLEQLPFSIAPDPRYLFLSERHREALAHLLYGLDGGGGFVLLTGEVGAGKTTVCRGFLQQMPAHCCAAYIFNPKLSAEELLATVCDEFGVALPDNRRGPPSIKQCVDALNAWLLAQHAAGKSCVLVIDEAQSLSGDVLEQLRLLTNLETDEKKLLQIILIGQPELRALVARPELTQLAQRVIARYHLGALSKGETAQYVAHRLAVAGWQGPLPFAPAALARVHALSGGVPRRINLLCDRALLAAYAAGHKQVDARRVSAAAREVFAHAAQPGAPRRWPLALAGLAGGVLLTGAALALSGHWPWRSSTPRAASAPVAAPAASAQAGAAGAPTAPAADESALWRRLASLWGAQLPEGALPCAGALPGELACWSTTQGDEALLRQLDRPVLLRLQGPAAPTGFALLRALHEGRAELLDARGQASEQPWSELAAAWSGAAFTLWRSPPGLDAAGVDIAATEAGSQWLAAQLDRAGMAAAPALRTRVRQFQRAQGLQSDGLAGPLTLMRLNRALGRQEPRLLAPTAAPGES